MPIDIKVPRSPGWWVARLARQLHDKKRLARLELLDSYLRGDPPLPLPVAARVPAASFKALLRKSRANLAELVVAATRERMLPTGFRTSADGDETGDAEAWRIWLRAGLSVESVDVHTAMLVFGESYVIVGPVDARTKVPIITYEDPRFVITAQDPVRRDRSLAGLKIYYDEFDEVTRAFLYLPGRLYSAHSRTGKRALPFGATTWEWDEQLGGADGVGLPHEDVSIVRFANQYDRGEFEPHVDVLDRINHQILQRLVIATYQAFRQRVVSGLPQKDEQDEEIDYSDLLDADPGSLWRLPADAKMWESGQADLTPILTAVDRDIQQLAASTRTPMSMLMPAGANQSAEGAAYQKEGQVFKAKDRIERAEQGWAQVMSLAFRVMGDEARADLDKLSTIWASPERRSLAEQADAFAKLSGEKLPFRTALILALGLTADEVDRIEVERLQDAVRAALLAPTETPALTGANETSGTSGDGS